MKTAKAIKTTELPPTITADTLTAITGLTHRRHRQLADDGYYPKPTGQDYQTVLTLTGLIKYLRTDYQKNARTLAQARQKKIETETELLELERDLKNGEVLPLAPIVAVLERGLVGMVAVLVQCESLDHDEKDKLCAALREAFGEAVKAVHGELSKEPMEQIETDENENP